MRMTGEPTLWQLPLMAVHLTVCLCLAVYGTHRYALVYLYYKYRRNAPRKTACFLHRPRVTIQLPMYNEHLVAARVIEAACLVRYPRDRLQIQVVDDSTDETMRIARETCDRMRAAGHNVVLLHRDHRTGFKAGALEEALTTASGEFIVIFDADFVPPPDILDHLLDHFVDPRVGMVQARWEHLNRDQSLLTKTQAILLDGHFVIEHAARNRSGRWMSFNGTAGAWRKSCIADAGGWQHDTLTEDLDLSYRAQMKGWKFVYLPEVTSPAELPPDMIAFKSQQHRWAKGGAQTCRKLLPGILRSRLPWRIKLEAFFHLTNCMSYFLMLFLIVLLFPVMYVKTHHLDGNPFLSALLDGSLILLATCSASTFYVAGQREIFRSWPDSLKYLPFLMSLGIGLSLNNARAAFEGFFGKASEFVRTPKFGVASGATATVPTDTAPHHRLNPKLVQAWLELAMMAYLVVCDAYAIYFRLWISLFFLLLFTIGYAYVALLTFASHYRIGLAAGPAPAPVQPLPAASVGRSQAAVARLPEAPKPHPPTYAASGRVLP
jgi:cellulose synthase/poly-beta-1,6-N-acetylglucosamine synthase-like glycosyltransferase